MIDFWALEDNTLEQIEINSRLYNLTYPLRVIAGHHYAGIICQGTYQIWDITP